MLKLLLKRSIQLLPVLWGVGTLVFLLLRLVPGDPVDIMLGESAVSADREALRASLHLNETLPLQYAHFWKSLLHGDLGESMLSKRKVSSLIAERVPATASLALCALAVALLLAVPLGVLTAVKEGSAIDRFFTFGSVLSVSIPGFWFGPMLMLLFSVKLGWLPVSERAGPETYVLPSLTLGLGMCAVLLRMTRASVLDALGQDYIVTAKSKGLSPALVYGKHALKNALIPVITLVGLQLGSLLAGAVITETIFDWPGLGELVYRAIQNRDYPLVQGCVLVIACTYVLANFLADALYIIVNPRLRS